MSHAERQRRYNRRKQIEKESLFDRAFELLHAGFAPAFVRELSGLRSGDILRHRAEKLLAQGAPFGRVLAETALGGLGLTAGAIERLATSLRCNESYLEYLRSL